MLLADQKRRKEEEKGKDNSELLYLLIDVVSFFGNKPP
jgi:hypothetical protein